jgi:flavin-dependent dehydrogenase
MATLGRLGVLDKMERAGFLPKHGAWVVSGCGRREVKFYFKNGFRSGCPDSPALQPTAYQVTRAEFDSLLLGHARECGADVFTSTEVCGVCEKAEEIQLDLRGSEGQSRSITARFVLDCSGRHSILGAKHGLKRPYPSLRKFAVYAHYENAILPEGPDGTLTRMVREADGWFWIIPLSRTKASVGWVTDIETFRAEKKKPEDLLAERIATQPAVSSVLADAERITPVYSSGDYSFRNRRLAGKRWLLAGDAAGFIDPVFSSGVFLALFSAESAADALNTVLENPSRAPRAFRSYQKNLGRVMDLYHTFVRGWYRQEFIETILNPTEFFQIVPAVNSVLAGNPGRDFSLLWRLWIFRVIVALQRRLPISPRLDLVPPARRASATGA